MLAQSDWADFTMVNGAIVRGHIQTNLEKINVIMTLGGGHNDVNFFTDSLDVPPLIA